ncbi:unnamed protein product, partial [Tilletia caries]
MVAPSRQGVGFAIAGSGSVGDGVAVPIDGFGPSGLPPGEGARGLEIFEILVVNKNIERRMTELKEVSPGLDGGDDGKEFFVMNVVVQLGRRHLPRHVGDGVQFAV